MYTASTSAFLALHIVSLLCALFTYYLLSTAPSIVTRSKTGSAHDRPRYRLLRLLCINSAFLSLMIVIPGVVYEFSLEQTSVAFCWIQGTLLQYSFIVQHMLALAIAIYMWLLLVRLDSFAETKYARHFYVLVYGVPLVAVLISTLVAASLTGWTLNTPPIGIQPRVAYCFVHRPYWLRSVAYTAWYMVAALPGMFFSIWAVVSLVRRRRLLDKSLSPMPSDRSLAVQGTSPRTCEGMNMYMQAEYEEKQKREHQGRFLRPPSDFRALGSSLATATTTIAGVPGTPAYVGGSSISRSIVYRKVLFVTMYTVIATFSIVPSIIQQANLMSGGEARAKTESDEDEMVQTATVGAVEFLSALFGVALFLFYGTGTDGIGRWRRSNAGQPQQPTPR